jgi:hypothetical protein
MSLNKLTNSADYLEKQYLNIGCNDIKCSSLEIKGQSITPQQPVDIDGGTFNPALSGNDLTLTTYCAFYKYNNNVMTIDVNVDFSATANFAITTVSCPLPSGYSIIQDAVFSPVVGYLSNHTTTPLTAQDSYTVLSTNSISVDFRQNGTNIVSGQIGRLNFSATFNVNPPS